MGDEFQVNSYTTASQDSAAVARSSSDFVVVWRSNGSDGDDNGSTSIQAQRYVNTVPVGDEFQVNSYTTGDQRRPDIAMSSGGNFLIVFDSDGSDQGDSSLRSIQAQRYDAGGATLGAQFQVNTYTTSLQAVASVGTDAIGSWVVVWESLGSAYGDNASRSIQAQRYDASGGAVGSQFQVNSTVAGDQYGPNIARSGSGAFVVVWTSTESSGNDASGRSIQGQRYDSSGSALGGEFQVNTYITNSQVQPAVAVNDGGDFIVTWTSNGSDGGDISGDSIQAQLYDSSGSAVGDQFQVNEFTLNDQLATAVSSDSLGNFVISWSSNGSIALDSSSYSVQAQRFRPDGSPLLSQFQVNTYSTSVQEAPAIASASGGNFVIAWQSAGSSGSDTSGNSVQSQLYSAPREVPALSALALLALGGTLLAAGSVTLRPRRD